MTDAEHDVVVVGAGPVGLAVALGLARENRSVLVLEKDDELSEHSRAPLIWPRTQEILSHLGVLGRFLDEGIVRSRLQLWDADQERVLVRFPIEELREETPCPQLVFCPQSRTERFLRAALEGEPSAEVRFSAEVTEVEQTEDIVKLRYEQNETSHVATAPFAAGCDGAHSRVRDFVSTSFEGTTYRVKAALADVTFEQEQTVHFPRLTRRRGVATALRIDDHLWRIIMPRAPQTSVPLDTRIRRAVGDLFSTTAFEAIWKSEFNLHRRTSSSFLNRRIVLAGDAAHLTSPVGGQGMNLGLQDAAALTTALRRALNQNTPRPLTTYAAERREAIDTGAVWATDRLTQVLLARRGAFLVPFLRAFGLLLRVRPLRHAVMRRMAMLDEPSRERT